MKLFSGLFIRLKRNRTRRNDGGYGVLVHHLCNSIAQQDDVLIKLLDLALQFDSVDEVDRNGHVILA